MARKSKHKEELEKILLSRGLDVALAILSHPVGIWLVGEIALVAADEKHLGMLDAKTAGELKTQLTGLATAYAAAQYVPLGLQLLTSRFMGSPALPAPG